MEQAPTSRTTTSFTRRVG